MIDTPEWPLIKLNCQAQRTRHCRDKGGLLLLAMYGFAQYTGRTFRSGWDVRPDRTRTGRRFVALKCPDCETYSEFEILP